MAASCLTRCTPSIPLLQILSRLQAPPPLAFPRTTNLGFIQNVVSVSRGVMMMFWLLTFLAVSGREIANPVWPQSTLQVVLFAE